jgi:hypothetical protein
LRPRQRSPCSRLSRRPRLRRRGTLKRAVPSDR